MKFTILGAGGFIGRNLCAYLKSAGHEHLTPSRDELSRLSEPLGHVIYAIGLTADFRWRPVETMEAHVCLLNRLLDRLDYESFVYLSSTRVYCGATSGSEDSAISVNPGDPDQFYNISKLAAEAICLTRTDERLRVARLSNVYGAGADDNNFLPALIKAARSGALHLQTSAESERDYISMEDAAELLAKISLNGSRRLYNVASGENVKTRDIVSVLARETGCGVTVADNAPVVKFPVVSTARIREEFGFVPKNLVETLPKLIKQLCAA
jgi:nucleoside-diphosphate-sugar epimerase